MRGSQRVALAVACLAIAPCLATLGVADVHESIARGDSLYAHGELDGARAAYRAALEVEPSSYTALVRIARTESELGEDARGDAQTKLMASAIEHARSAVRVAPDSAEGHTWLAASLGRQALKEGPKKRLALAREIKAEADRAIALDPSRGRPYHVRALWNRNVARLNAFERLTANAVLGGVPKGASMENAVRDLEKAVELEPAYVNHRLELGRTLMMMHRKADARRELEHAVELPSTSNSRDAKYQAEARELLKKLR